MNKPKILIIDDEKTVKQALKKALKNEGYELFFADDGKQGLEQLKTQEPDLVFLDLKMPVMDGLEFLKAIKIKHDDTYHVVVITGHGEDKDIDACYKLGVTSFLRKPLSMTEICCLAKRCIQLKQIERELQDYRQDLEKLVKKQTSQIEEQLRFQQTLIDAIPSPIYFMDKKSKFIGVNNAFAQCFGVDKESVTGTAFDALLPKQAGKKNLDMDKALLKNDTPQSYQLKIQYADGKKHDVVFCKAVFQDQKGKTAGFIGTIFDITDKEEAMAKVAEKSKALNQANMALRILIKQLSDAQQEERVGNMPNLKELVLPNKDQLESILANPNERAYIDNIMLNLNRVTSSFAKKLSKRRLGLSPKEIQVADLIRIGLSNKEAAIQMNVTKSTIEFHRDNLRRKLKLKHAKKNLRAYLMALDAEMASEKDDSSTQKRA